MNPLTTISFEKSVSQAVTSLAAMQQKDGSFLSYASDDRTHFANTNGYHSPFATALILSSLNCLENSPEIREMKQKSVNFLLSQKSRHWSFNYWKRNSKEAKALPYPDDLDDTFCALSALYNYDKGLLDGAALAHIIQLLITTETAEGGPYRTWLIGKNAGASWQDVDLAVNSNIAYFLSLQDIVLPSVLALIELAIEKNQFISPYYPDEFAIIYYICRFYRGSKKELLEKYLLQKRKEDYSWGTPLQTALAVNSLLQMGTQPQVLQKSIEFLIASQKEGFWQASGFCIDPMRQGVTYYSGAPALTTAFCMEAITRFLVCNPTKRMKKSSTAPYLYQEVIKKVKKEFLAGGKEFQQTATKQLNRTITSDTDKQIILLPWYVTQSLGAKGKKISQELIIQLSMASLFGWISYTIYDDFLDDEGYPRALSVANFSLRQLTRIFDSVLPQDSQFQEMFHSIMTDLDSANAWEIAHCRITIIEGILQTENFQIPQFASKKQLAQKSLGHALGAAAIVFSLGYTTDSLEMKRLFSFFTNYLIARQLNDDAHDWEEDLRKGHVNAVGAFLLEKKRNLIASNSPLEQLIPHLQEFFWYEGLPTVSQEILSHTKKARRALHKISLIHDTRMFEQILVRVEESAHRAIAEQKNAVLFLETYQQS